MPPSPTIPTSFVPKQPVKSAARFSKSGGNTFLVLACFTLGLALVGVAGVFAYSQYLTSVERAKSVALAQAEASINADEVEGFIRARDRFTAAVGILDNHVAMSGFFDLLESITLVNVRFDSFSSELLPDGSADISLSGSARSFNALAAQSTAFSSEKLIRRAIFSGIQVAENGTVDFTVTAEVDPRLIAFTIEELPAAPVVIPSAPVATTTVPVATTTTVTPTTPPATTAPTQPITPPSGPDRPPTP